MVSDKIKALKTTLSLCSARKMSINGGLLRMMQRSLSDIHEQVLAMEQAVIAPPQRPFAKVRPADLASGKVSVIGVAYRNNLNQENDHAERT